MAVSKTISANGSNGHHKFTLVVKETATSTANNTSTISITFTLSPVSTGWDWEDHSSVNGTVTVAGTEYTWTCPTYNGSSTVTLVSKTKTIDHGSDGTKSISLKFSVSSSSSYAYLPGTASASGTLALTAIPRYGTSVQSLNTKTETSIKMNWSSDSTVDYIWYTTNASDSTPTWTGVNVTDGKSGTYTISSGLNPNSTYKIKTRIRRKDSQLTTDSSTLSVTTYSYPYAKTMPNFTVGNSVTITLENPLSRSCTVYLQKGSNSNFAHTISGTTSGTSITFSATTERINDMYSALQNASSGTYYVRTSYSSSNIDKAGGKYSVDTSTNSPTVGAITYTDTDSTITAITGNNQYIVQGKSKVKVSLSSSNITLKNGATVGSVKATIEGSDYNMPLSGSTYTMNSACTVQSNSNVVAKVTVTDSRGLTGTSTITMNVCPYSVPSVSVTAARANGYNDSTTITASASYSPIKTNNGNQNSITYTCQKKPSNESNWTSVSLTASGNTATGTTTINNTVSCSIKVTIQDRFGSTATAQYTVPVGYPLIFFDTKNNSVSINSFPTGQNQFVVNGVDILDALFYKPGDKITIDRLPIAGLITTSRRCVLFGVSCGKSLANITSVTCTKCIGGIRVPAGGYLESGNGGTYDTNWITLASSNHFSIQATKIGDYHIQLRFDKESGYDFDNSVNNTPLTLYPAENGLEFTLN